jgi:ABC-type sugar transport system ATPase subunit
MNTGGILELKNISKAFPGVKALDDVSMSVKKGEIHALVGENGAGKSTLIKILTGVHVPDSGEIIFRGKSLTLGSPLEAMEEGINVVHQELNLAENLNVCENIFLGRPLRKTVMGLPFIDWKMMYRESEALLERLKISISLQREVKTLSVAQKQIIEIAKAIYYKCDLVVMDEPSATLTENELDILFTLLRRLKEDGVTIIYISHRLEEIFKLADTVTVLRDGKHIATGDVVRTTRDELIRDMVGRDLVNEYPKKEVPLGREVLRVEHVTNERLRDISFNLRSGEILGIAGLVGAGRTELARAIFGADEIESGELYLRGSRTNIRDVSTAISNNIGLVPEERKIHGLVLDMTVRENVTMVGIDKVIVRGLIGKREEISTAKDYIKKLDIRTPGHEMVVKNLSGGNQQKTVLAKWLFADADILIFDEPTRGIDVGAKFEIYQLLTELVEQGKAVMMISSEMPELIGMADRILVMHEGRITGELSRKDFSQERIMDLAAK